MEQQEKKMSVFQSISYALKMIWNADKGIVLFTFFKNISEEIFCSFFFVYMIKVIFKSIEKRTSFRHLIITVTIFCLIHLWIHINSASHLYYNRIKSVKVYQFMFKKIIKKAREMELSRCEQSDYYDQLSRSLDECLTKSLDGMTRLSFAIGTGCAIVTSIIMVIQVDYKLVFFICIPALISLYLGEKVGNENLKLSREETFDKRIIDYVKRVFYEKKYAGEIRLYKVRNILWEKHKEAYTSRYKINEKRKRKIAFYQVWDIIIYMLVSMACSYLYIAIVLKKSGASSIAGYVAIISVMNYICWTLKGSITDFVEAGKLCIYMNNLKEFLEYLPKEEYQGKEILEQPIEKIQFDHVDFSYGEGQKNILKDLSFTLNKGEKIALVGENGAGKTTLIKLLLGLYLPSKGSVRVNGIEIDKLNRKEYQKRFGTVFQDLQIFSLSLADNVLAKKPENKEEEALAIEALKLAQFSEEYEQLEHGLDTMLTKEFDDSGVICSGGQAQKIAIARVFAKKGDVSILDEPSSALDPISEYRLYQNLLGQDKERTIVFISHRLSSARLADKIYYLEQGRIVESGTHDELIQLDGRYAKLFHLQAKNYAERREFVRE